MQILSKRYQTRFKHVNFFAIQLYLSVYYFCPNKYLYLSLEFSLDVVNKSVCAIVVSCRRFRRMQILQNYVCQLLAEFNTKKIIKFHIFVFTPIGHSC